MSKKIDFTATKTALEVLAWLQNEGYKIAKSKFYGDLKVGRLKKDTQGIFTKRLVMKYARLLKKQNTGLTEKEEREDLASKKARAEIAKLEMQTERERLRLKQEEGKLIERALFNQELAARIILLDSSFKKLARDKTPAIISKAGGRQTNREVVSGFLLEAWEDMLNEYATTKKFHVLILPAERQENQTETGIGNEE